MILFDLPDRPIFPASDLQRVEHTSLRRRMLYGMWAEDANRRRLERLGVVRTAAAGRIDISGNPFRQWATILAVLYESPPTVTYEAGQDANAEALIATIEAAGYWELMIRGQRDTIGLRQHAWKIEAEEDRNSPLGHSLVFRPVWADRVIAAAAANAPDIPVLIMEPVLRRTSPTAQPVWTWDAWSIADPAEPYFRVYESDGTTELRRPEAYGADAMPLVGEAYPYRDETGAPVLPYSWYHAERTGMLWDPYEAIELVEGTLELAVDWSNWGRSVDTASWSQRYAVNLEVPADTVGEGATARSHVVADPSTILMLRSVESFDGAPTGQPMIGHFAPPTNPRELCEAILTYERRIVSSAGGLSPADFQRVEGDPRSGYAMALNQAGQLKVQLRYLRSFLRGDLGHIRACAAVLSAATGARIPTTGYAVEHALVARPEDAASTGPGALQPQTTEESTDEQ